MDRKDPIKNHEEIKEKERYSKSAIAAFITSILFMVYYIVISVFVPFEARNRIIYLIDMIIGIISIIFLLISIYDSPKPKTRLKGKYFAVIAFIIILITCSIISIPNMLRKNPKPKILRCKNNLRNLGLMVEEYSTDHDGHFPEKLYSLVEEGYMKEIPICPVKEDSYFYYGGWNSDNFTITCPNPLEHIGEDGPKSFTTTLFYRNNKKLIHHSSEY